MQLESETKRPGRLKAAYEFLAKNMRELFTPAFFLISFLAVVVTIQFCVIQAHMERYANLKAQLQAEEKALAIEKGRQWAEFNQLTWNAARRFHSDRERYLFYHYAFCLYQVVDFRRPPLPPFELDDEKPSPKSAGKTATLAQGSPPRSGRDE
jgi:hypothetical protein